MIKKSASRVVLEFDSVPHSRANTHAHVIRQMPDILPLSRLISSQHSPSDHRALDWGWTLSGLRNGKARKGAMAG